MDLTDAASPRRLIETNGYWIAPGVLSREETANLRRTLLAHFRRGGVRERLGRHQPGSAIMIPGLHWLLCHPGILSAIRGLLGDGQLVFCGNCDTHLNMLSHWHRDINEHLGGCFRGDYLSRPDCRVYRAGIYLQDHDTDHLGLKVRRGSHRQRNPDGLPDERPRTHEGDVAFFDIRVIHAGVLPDPFEHLLLAIGRRLGWPRWVIAIKDAWWRLTGKHRKLSTFFTFGIVSSDTEDYCRFELELLRKRLGAQAVRLPAALRAALKSAGVLTYEDAIVQHYGDEAMNAFATGAPLPPRIWGQV
ncbi:hypothetical protein [Emcibacter sp. SYSU 3D8]|uniref:hypothetical protein n=1 Tax=Emcibacter sp. SYSU 3D8 TaxID=3133969 RepID=UPI0031FE4F8C